MQHAANVGSSRFTNNRARIILGVTSVHHDGLPRFPGKLDLRGEHLPLCCARRIIVVVVEATLTDGDRFAQQRPQKRDIAGVVEACGVMGMDSGSREDEAGILDCDLAGDPGGRQRFTDADDGSRARVAGAGDYVVAVAVERRVREVGVAVDEDGRIPPV